MPKNINTKEVGMKTFTAPYDDPTDMELFQDFCDECFDGDENAMDDYFEGRDD